MGPPTGKKDFAMPGSVQHSRQDERQMEDRRADDRDVRYRPNHAPSQPVEPRVLQRPIENDELPVQDNRDTVDGRRYRSHVHVNVETVNEETPDILTSFIVNRMENDGHDVPSSLSRRNKKVESEIANVLQRIGDDLSNNRNLNSLISEIQVTPQTAYAKFVSVAVQIFSDGNINWGRIVTLFYFAYKLALQVVNQLPLIDIIINWVTRFVADKLATWIAQRGGWGAVREYFGSTSKQLIGVFFAGILVSSLFWWWKR